MSATVNANHPLTQRWINADNCPTSADDWAGGVHTPGTLWERVAETPSNAPAPLTARQDAGIVRAYAARDERRGDRPVCIGAQKYQGPILGRHVCGDHHSHGIIRAGQRVK